VTPLQIGITGGIGSGKSLVCRIFQILGAPVYDADSRAKDLMTTDGILISRIKKEFGELSYRQDGSLNREYLGEKVFNDAERLKVLNSLVHPRVAEDYTQWVGRHQQALYVIKEAALLFEAGSYKALDKVIVVHAPSSVRIKRVLSRDKHRTEAQVREIMKNQLPDEDTLARADFIIRNDESQLVITQVLDLHHQFSAMH
jgi:dephospho-CoA kinase